MTVHRTVCLPTYLSVCIGEVLYWLAVTRIIPCLPSGHMTFLQRSINVDAKSQHLCIIALTACNIMQFIPRRINVDATPWHLYNVTPRKRICSQKTSFRKGLGVQKRKQEVTKFVALLKTTENLSFVSRPLKRNEDAFKGNTVITLSIRTPQLLTMLVLKFEQVQFIIHHEWQTE